MVSITSTNNLDKIKELYKKTDELNKEIKGLVNEIKPLEFESYTDYFIIHTFKKGISESGRVNIENLRRREHSIYYKRIRRSNNPTAKDVTVALPPSRSPSEGSVNPVTPVSTTPAMENNSNPQSNEVESNINNDSSSSDNDDDRNDDSVTGDKSRDNKVSSEITTNSIISTYDTQEVGSNSVRRSSRLSEKERQDKVKKEHDHVRDKTDREESRKRPKRQQLDNTEGEFEYDDNNRIIIKDLYEMLVPKITDPTRRSDCILPPRLKFTPEKQMHTRPEFVSIKINELVGMKRIRAVLSHFEGGVAGVRKRDNTEQND